MRSFFISLKIVFIIVTAGLMLYLSFFTIYPGQQVVVSRFGKIIDIHKTGGLKVKWPFETTEIHYPSQLQRLEIGFRTDLSKRTFSDHNLKPQLWEIKHESFRKQPRESLVITSDENIVDVNSVLHYKIKDLRDYLVNVNDQQLLIKNVVESSIRSFLGKKNLEEILIGNKSALQYKLKKEIQTTLDKYQTGIEILRLNFQDIHPPIKVVRSFRDVASAREDRNTKIYNAIEYKEKIIPNARGQAHEMILKSQALKEKRILEATGDYIKFNQLNKIYKKNPTELKLKNYYDKTRSILNDSKLYIVSKNLVNNLEILNPINNQNKIIKNNNSTTTEKRGSERNGG